MKRALDLRRIVLGVALATAPTYAAACHSDGLMGLPSPAQIRITAPDTQLYVGQTMQLLAVGLDASGAELPSLGPQWSTSNANVAQVTSTGLITAVAAGTATIRASLSGKFATVDFSVQPPPTYNAIVGVGATALTAPNVVVRSGGTVRFDFGATALGVTFRLGSGDGAPSSIAATANASVNRSFYSVGDFYYDVAGVTGVSGVVRVR